MDCCVNIAIIAHVDHGKHPTVVDGCIQAVWQPFARTRRLAERAG